MTKKLTATLLLAAVLGLAGTKAASAKTPVDKFAEFKGNFSGTASFVVTEGEPPYTGTGTIAVTGPKSGKSLLLTFAGTVIAGGTPVPYSNSVTFSKSGACTIADGIFRFGGMASSASSGTATIGKKVISETGAFSLGGVPQTLAFTIQSKTTGKKRTLTINYVITNSSGTYPFAFVVSGKVKK